MDETWRTRDGREIPVCDMSEEHAKAALRMILRQRKVARYLRVAAQADERFMESLFADFYDDLKWGDNP